MIFNLSFQRVIMTPRSRCPIIVNSSTNLSSVAIPEENSQTAAPQNTKQYLVASEENLHTPVITSYKALRSSPETVQPQTSSTVRSSSSLDCIPKLSDVDFENENNYKDKEQLLKDTAETKLSRWGSSTLKRTLSSASSTSSLFGNFFRHLSTTSLSQLATKLTSVTSVHSTETEKEESVEECDSSDDLDESLSSVFKGYLLSRSILTDSPVDLSVLYIDEDNADEESHLTESKSDSDNGDDLGDSAYESSHPSSKTTSRQCSKASLSSLDSAQEFHNGAELSESLLYCLDGHDPYGPVATGAVKCSGESKQLYSTEEQSHNTISQKLSSDKEQPSGLLSCTPEGRSQSLLKTKQGTPVPQRESNHSVNGNTCGVFFETSF